MEAAVSKLTSILCFITLFILSFTACSFQAQESPVSTVYVTGAVAQEENDEASNPSLAEEAVESNELLVSAVESSQLPAPEPAASDEDLSIPLEIHQEPAQEQALGNTVAYTVKRGETLYTIARLCNTTMDAIMAINPSIISPELIYVGQIIQIPTDEQTAPTNPPIGPLLLNTAVQSSSSIDLQWNDAQGEDGYRIFVKIDGASSWQSPFTVPANQTSQLVEALQPETTYHFLIQAFNNWGNLDSNEATEATAPSTPGGSPPVGPIALSVEAQSSTSINVKWEDVQGEDGYRLYWKVSGSSDEPLSESIPANRTNQLLTNLVASTPYDIYIQAFNEKGVIESDVITQTTFPQENINVDGAKLGINLVETVRTLPENLLRVCVQGIALATSAGAGNQQLLTVGTVSVANSGQVQYSPEPADRLRINGADGSLVDCTISTFDGDIFQGVEFYLNNSHHFAGQIQSGTNVEGFDIQVQSIKDDRNKQQQANGAFGFGNVAYTISLTSSGQASGESSFGGSEYRSSETLQGTVNHSSVSLNINESTQFEQIVHSGESASLFTRTFNNTWHINGDSFQLLNANFALSHRDGSPSRWEANGQLIRNDQAYGELTMRDDGVFIRLLMQLPNEQIELGSWPK